jgi:hypothetical protein
VMSASRSVAGRRRFEKGFVSTKPMFLASSYMVPITRETLRGTLSAQVRALKRSTSPSGVEPKYSAKRFAAAA